MIKWKQQQMKLPSFGLDFHNPSFCQYADAYGAQGHCLKRTEELLPLLRGCLAGGGVHVIEIPVDYSDNDRLFHQDLPRSCETV